MKVVAFVPMKLNNERLPGKNTRQFHNGKPLLTYALDALRGAVGIDEIYIYCSSPEAEDYASDRVKFLSRSKTLDQSTTRINEVLEAFANDVVADVYVLVHATAPFLRSESISTAIGKVLDGGKHDSALAVVNLQEFFWKDGLPFNYDPSSIPRTQDLPPFLMETNGLYVYLRHLITKENRRVGHTPFLLEVDRIEAFDINEMVDFEIADAYLKQTTHG